MRNRRKQLAAAVFQRRVDLGISSRRKLAEIAGVSERTANAIEMGESVSAQTLYKIETRALKWQPGSSEAILSGAEPTPVDDDQPGSRDGHDHATDTGAEAVLREQFRIWSRTLPLQQFLAVIAEELAHIRAEAVSDHSSETG